MTESSGQLGNQSSNHLTKMLSEKKWFVYMGDHHIGPHSMEEISGKMSHGQITAQHFVWAQGMVDWRLMHEVSDFDPLVKHLKQDTQSGQSLTKSEEVSQFDKLAQAIEAEGPKSINEPIHEPVLELKPSLKTEAEVIDSNTDSFEDDSTQADFESKPTLGQKILRFFTVSVFTLFLLIGIFAGAYYSGILKDFMNHPKVQKELASDSLQPVVQFLSQYLTFLDEWVSPFPPLEQVNATEYEELKAAAKANIENDGPRSALAIVQQNLGTPVFYVATNIPQLTRFRLYIVGIQDTLVNQMSFQAHTDVVVDQKLGRTSAIGDVGMKSLPLGEYGVYLVPRDAQSNSTVQKWASAFPVLESTIPPELPKTTRVVAYKKYFLGGKKDAAYYVQLKEYHEKLKIKAEHELSEAKEFTVTLENQLKSAIEKFQSVRSGKLNAAKKTSWNAFHFEWNKFQNQLTQIFDRWTSATLQNNYFYSSLFYQIQQVGMAVQKVDSLHLDYLNGSAPKDLKTFEAQLKEATLNAQNGIEALKAKIQQIEVTPLDSNGLPRREVL